MFPSSLSSENEHLPAPKYGQDGSRASQSSSVVDIQFCQYDRQFDRLSDPEKAQTIIMLLELLPPVKEMRDYLLRQSQKGEPKLKHWVDRINPASRSILRWIISSNRSVILQVDSVPEEPSQTESVPNISANETSPRLDQKVTGMDSWIQFRFAQGSPDKEQRFIDSLKSMSSKLNPRYPTLFAWHGSSVSNWSSIISTGLDFNDTVNGRAYGHGCYFSQDLTVSHGYSSRAPIPAWPGSQLQISTALAMTEIVNSPLDYTSRTPYLVVQHVDWIQCRYLFVNRVPTNQTQRPVKPK